MGLHADKFKMCVHSVEEDMYVSGSLIREGVWERPILEQFVRTLEKFPDAAVLDVGAQLGMYGLQAAHMKRKVPAQPVAREQEIAQPPHHQATADPPSIPRTPRSQHTPRPACTMRSRDSCA